MPSFATWTDLRTHVKSAHPPTCPYPECKGRTFAKKRNLSEHLKVHREQEDGAALNPEPEPVMEDSDDDYLPASRKRRRSASAASGEGTPKRLRRSRSVSEGVQAFPCDVVGCTKSFKTVSPGGEMI